MKIIDDKGAIEGWVIALCETIVVFALLVLGFFVESVRQAWAVMGTYVQTIYPLALGSWLAYKAVKAFSGGER